MEAVGTFIVRKELEWFRRDIDGPCWLVKDPIALKFSRLEDEEKWILDRVAEGWRTEQIVDQFPIAFPSQKLCRNELVQFLNRCWQEGVIVADCGEHCSMVEQVINHQRRSERPSVQALLFAKVPLFNPARLLTDANVVAGWIFSKVMLLCWTLCSVLAVTMILTRRELFVAQMTDLPTLLSHQNLLVLWMVFVCTKVVHELGHGISCHRYGGVCHEMGFFLFFLTPCFYCDVTDSWQFRSRRERLVVALGGMYFESWLAILATFVWWQTMPGTALNICAINVMLVCSIATLVINMNPLLKFDGYFVLCDLVGIPNLRTRSFKLMKRMLWPFGSEHEHVPIRRVVGMLVYAVAAITYRLLMLAVILWAFVLVIENMGLGPLGILLSAGLLALIVGSLILKALRMNFVAAIGVWLRVGIIAAILAIGISIPLPHYVSCDLVVVPQNASNVVVTETGTLSRIYVREGERVDVGEKLLQLSDADLEDRIDQLQNRSTLLKQQHKSLLERATSEPHALDSLAATEATIKTVERQLQSLRQQQGRLTLVAPCQGIIYRVTSNSEMEQDDMTTWEGSPLESDNQGARLDRGTIVCQIGDERRDIQLRIPERHLDEIAAGMGVRCTIVSSSNMPINASIIQVARVEDNPEDSSVFIAVCRAQQNNKVLLPGSGGKARIKLKAKSVAQRIVESLRMQWRSQLVSS